MIEIHLNAQITNVVTNSRANEVVHAFKVVLASY